MDVGPRLAPPLADILRVFLVPRVLVRMVGYLVVIVLCWSIASACVSKSVCVCVCLCVSVCVCSRVVA
jgi:hypothetical protein